MQPSTQNSLHMVTPANNVCTVLSPAGTGGGTYFQPKKCINFKLNLNTGMLT
jgi:hypothetical protein